MVKIKYNQKSEFSSEKINFSLWYDKKKTNLENLCISIFFFFSLCFSFLKTFNYICFFFFSFCFLVLCSFLIFWFLFPVCFHSLYFYHFFSFFLLHHCNWFLHHCNPFFHETLSFNPFFECFLLCPNNFLFSISHPPYAGCKTYFSFLSDQEIPLPDSWMSEVMSWCKQSLIIFFLADICEHPADDHL